MRRSMFGDYYAENTEDDLGEAFMAAELEPGECYAMISEDDDGYMVEFFGNENGEPIATTDHGMFSEIEAAQTWARGWVDDVQINT